MNVLLPLMFSTIVPKGDNQSTWTCDWSYTSLCILPWRRFDFPLWSSKSAVLYVKQGSIWQPVTRALSDYWHQRDAERESVRLFGGWRTASRQQRASFKPVSCDFPTQRKAIVALKKVKLKSLAWYVLTTACCLCNTSKYVLSSHSCSLLEG